ncbi:MAG: nuclear transport factor 2 family protein [Actinomycetota bacterium]|nr:nuclear transport factor 2 family protein [Actinomycetota bacterium]
MATTIDAQAGVQRAMDEWAAAYAAKDVERLMGLLASGDDLVLVGTGSDEVCVTRDEIRQQATRDFAQADEVRLDVGKLRVSGRGDVSWAFAEPTVTVRAGGEQIHMAVRLTAVFVREGEDWRMSSAHLSVPSAAQAEGRSYADA